MLNVVRFLSQARFDFDTNVRKLLTLLWLKLGWRCHVLQARNLAQGRKGTAEGAKQVGVRCPKDLYDWLSAGKGPRETDTDRVIAALEFMRDAQAAAGQRMPEPERRP